VHLQVFSDSVVQSLWQLTEDVDTRVASAAFRALAAFPTSCFHLLHLPVSVSN